MRTLFRFIAAALAFVAFALFNPVFLLGCGPTCGPGGFDYSEEDVMQNLEPYAGSEHVYTASNSNGSLTLTLKIAEDSFRSSPHPARFSLDSSTPGLVSRAAACSYDEDEDILVSGVFSATFEFDDGRTEELFVDKDFDAIYTLDGSGNRPSSGTFTVDLPYEVYFELNSATGQPNDLEMRRFAAEDFAAADIQPF